MLRALSLLLAWLVFPLVALVASLGLGLLVERAAGAAVPGVLLLPLGMAGLVCVTQLPTFWDETAEATLPLVVLCVPAGLWLGRRRLRNLAFDPWPALAALGVFGVFAAPVVLSFAATFAGYTVLGDTSIHFIGADALLTLGRDFASLPPSSYEFSLSAYYGANGYPSGGPTAIGALTSLVGQDVAWTFQPFLSLLVALMALSLYALAEPLVPSRALRAGVAFVAAQPALVLAYALQGSVKEIGTAYGLVLCFALVPVYARQAGEGARRVLPLVVAASATVGIVGLAAGVWLGPLIVAAGALAFRAGARVLLGAAALAAVVGAALNFQALADLTTYVAVSGGVVTSQAEFGNLLGPLEPRSRFGVWLTGDYRIRPTSLWTETKILQTVVWLAMAAGAFWVLRRRSWSVALFLVISLVAHVYVMRTGSPWADGKALMIVSPAVLLLAGAAAGLAASWRRAAGSAVVIAVGFGVLWSNALAYHEVSNAPRDRLEELAQAGERIDGEGPTLYPEFEEFAKHFLRDGAPEGPTEGWQRRYELSKGRDGNYVRQGLSVDIDRFTDRYMREFRTVVLRRGFASSRPGSSFERVWRGRFYEIWQRPLEDRLIEHLSVGTFRDPSGPADCNEVRRLADRALEEGGELVFAPRPRNLLVVPAYHRLPAGWYPDATEGIVLIPRGPGDITMLTDVPAGEYDLWAEGSFGRGVDVRVDGRSQATIRDQLNGRGAAEHVSRVRLEGGSHRFELLRGGGDLRPGNGGGSRFIGPLALTPPDPTGLPLQRVQPRDYAAACNRDVDWVEAVRR